jgi:membrane fusion protein (multidrug efflux system)
VRAKLPANCGLRPGQFLKIRIVSEEHKDCLAVPIASLARDAAGASFIALVQEEKAVLKPVKPGLRDGDLVEVEGEGLEADLPIVTEGAYGLIMTQQFATKIRVLSE